MPMCKYADMPMERGCHEDAMARISSVQKFTGSRVRFAVCGLQLFLPQGHKEGKAKDTRRNLLFVFSYDGQVMT